MIFFFLSLWLYFSAFFSFYNTFYKPDIDLRSLTFQYLEVKQTLRLRWHLQKWPGEFCSVSNNLKIFPIYFKVAVVQQKVRKAMISAKDNYLGNHMTQNL